MASNISLLKYYHNSPINTKREKYQYCCINLPAHDDMLPLNDNFPYDLNSDKLINAFRFFSFVLLG